MNSIGYRNAPPRPTHRPQARAYTNEIHVPGKNDVFTRKTCKDPLGKDYLCYGLITFRKKKEMLLNLIGAHITNRTLHGTWRFKVLKTISLVSTLDEKFLIALYPRAAM